MKLLIVEDQQFTREGQISILRAMYQNIDIVEAFSIEQATSVPDKEGFDFVFLDYGLPDSEGVDSLLSIQRLFGGAKIVVVSGQESRNLIRAAIKHKAHGYLPKSYQGQQLIDTLRILLNGTPYFPAWVILDEFDAKELQSSDQEILDRLTPRQKEVLVCLYDAKVDKIISDELSIQIGTVRKHNHDIYQLFDVNNRTALLQRLKDSEFWQQAIALMRKP